MGSKPSAAAEGQPRKTRWLKRQALQISGMLPDDPDDARRVVGYMAELQAGFLTEEELIASIDRPEGKVVSIVAGK